MSVQGLLEFVWGVGKRVSHSLQACLGIGAKTTEPNIITLTTQDSNGEELTLPFAYLSGNNPQVSAHSTHVSLPESLFGNGKGQMQPESFIFLLNKILFKQTEF